MRIAKAADGRATNGPSTTSQHAARNPQPAQLALSADGGSRERTALALHAAAGNRAVASTVAEIGRQAAAQPDALRVVNAVASTAAPAPGGVLQIAGQAVHAAGVTSLPAPGAPDVVIGAPLKQTDGRWQATINPTSVTPDAAVSLFPGVGLHADSPTVTGMQVHRDVTPAASAEIKAGEEEHLTDLEWARHLAYDQVADAVNRAAATPATGDSSEEARKEAMFQVRSAVPEKARWPEGREPIAHWRRVYGQLVAVTRERDEVNRWHNMSSEAVADPKDRKRLGIPKGHELLRYIAGTTEVGKHPSEPLVNARYQSLATEPMGVAPSTLKQLQNPPPAKGPSATGDFEPNPNAPAVAIRSRSAKGRSQPTNG